LESSNDNDKPPEEKKVVDIGSEENIANSDSNP
jgi:hypothetical protein